MVGALHFVFLVIAGSKLQAVQSAHTINYSKKRHPPATLLALTHQFVIDPSRRLKCGASQNSKA